MKVEAYTAGGILSGRASQPDRLLEDLEAERAIELDGPTWYPLGGGAAERRGHTSLDPESVLVVVTEAGELPIHASWHAVELDVGPYRVTAELPTVPGFDPGRAISRPGGPFVLVREARIELAGQSDGGRVDRPTAHVNRYAVEQVAADIDLGFYFPGARFLSGAGVPLA